MLDAWWVNLLTRKSKFQMEIHHDVTQNWRKDPTPTTDLLYVSMSWNQVHQVLDSNTQFLSFGWLTNQ